MTKKNKEETKPITMDQTIQSLQNQINYQQNLIGKLYVELNFTNEVLQARQAEIDELKK